MKNQMENRTSLEAGQSRCAYDEPKMEVMAFALEKGFAESVLGVGDSGKDDPLSPANTERYKEGDGSKNPDEWPDGTFCF